MLSERFEHALRYAGHIHAGQTRQGTEVPYMAHLLGVASIVLEYGGSENEAIAALLHDTAEEGGGKRRLEDIRVRFGEEVANIVDGCTDCLDDPRPPWRTRKAAYIGRIPRLSDQVRLVVTADLLHNARSNLKDLREHGDRVWSRFKGGKDGTLWYYRCVVQAFKTVGITHLLEELERVVVEVEKLAAKTASETASVLASRTILAGH